MSLDLLQKFVRFVVVGFTGLIIDFGLTFLAKEKVRIPKYIANAIGFTAAATSNYFLNRIWTFESNNPQIEKEFLSFFIISLIGLGINTYILWVQVSKLKWNFYFSKFNAILITTFWNFLANLYITFSGVYF